MWRSLNVHQLKAGDRVQITDYFSGEALPIGTMGTVTYVNEGSYKLTIHMKWDNGSTTAILEGDENSYRKV